ncbi:MAG: thioredoxin [Desulfocucumaceae bacterium]
MAVEINEDIFEKEVIKSDKPVLVDFWAPWCGPCRSLAPIIEDLSKEFEGRVKVCKVNVDNNKEIAGKYGIMSIPTMMLFKNGKVAEQLVGLTQKSVLAKKLEGLL